MQFNFQKLISTMASFDNWKNVFQDFLEHIAKCICLVKILHTDLKLAENDTIFPVTFAYNLADTKKLKFSRFFINVTISSNLLSCNSIVPLTRFHLNPSQSKLWTGAHDDFSATTNPALPCVSLTKFDACKQLE